MTATIASATADRAGRPRAGALTGTPTLLRFALRRDRVRLPVWIVAIVLTTVATATTFPDLYREAADRQARAELMNNPAAIALGGPRVGLDDYTFGAMMTNEMLGFVAVAVALMSILLVARHTRADEEAGRTELIRANVVGRHASLAAALTVAVGANLALGAATAAGLAALGLESMDVAGSWLFGAALTAVGLVFAAIAAVTAQVTEHARGATGIAGMVLGAAYAVRAAGDVRDDWLSWLSPIAWSQRTYAYVDDRWWPLLLALATTAVLVPVAVALSGRRDVGAGLRPTPTGPATASPRLSSALALTLRLQRGSLVGWTVAFLAFGLLFGTLLADIEGFVAELAAIDQVFAVAFEDQMVDAFIGLIASLFAMTAAIHAVLATLRARTEETVGRAEPVLATSVARGRWLAGHAAVAAVGSVVMLLMGAVGFGVTGATAIGDATVVATVLGAALVHVAPLLFTVGVAVALFGLVPRASQLAWVVVVYAFTAGMLGGLLGLPAWADELSPFGAVPMVPVEELTLVPIVVLVALGAALAAAGFAGFRRRDLDLT